MKYLSLPSYGDSRYAKLYNAALGFVVSLVLTWLLSKGLGNCVSAPGGGQVCTYGGYSETMINQFLQGLLTLLFVHQSPPNTPPPREDT